MYDNTKFEIAIKNWLKACCKKGFGEEYAGDLLDSFIKYCKRSKDMKRSPGRVVFGKELARLGFDRRKLAGLTYWSGLALRKAPKKTAVRRYKKTTDAIDEKVKVKKEKVVSDKAEARKEKIQHRTEVQKRMARETPEAARAAGGPVD